MITHTSQVFDPTRVAHLSGPFAPVTAEVDKVGLRVDDRLPDGLRWYDVEGGRSELWPTGDLSVGEPVFAPTPGGADGEGHWLTFATDRTDGTSWFLVIPADAPASGPLARVRIPVRVPLGLHGTWLPTEEPTPGPGAPQAR